VKTDAIPAGFASATLAEGHQVIDTTTNGIMSEHAAWRKAFNATHKLEPEPSLRKTGFRDPQWRYLIHKA